MALAPPPAQLSAMREALTTGLALMGTGSTLKRFESERAGPRLAQSATNGFDSTRAASSQRKLPDRPGACAARAAKAGMTAQSRSAPVFTGFAIKRIL